VSEEEPDFEALQGAVASVRHLTAHLRKTRAPKELLNEVDRQVAALNERLAPYDYEGPYQQRRLVLTDADMSGSHSRDTDDPAEFFPYSPVIGPLNPIAPAVSFNFDGEEMSAEHIFDAPYNGPPTAVHGGVIALVFDELLGTLGALRDIGGFTGTLTVRYLALTPIGKRIRMRSWIDRREGRKCFIKGTMHNGDRLCAEAEGIFIRPKVSMLEHAMASQSGNSHGD
jgi:acyl-coenzyme A thioesterase PaaI-like protein